MASLGRMLCVASCLMPVALRFPEFVFYFFLLIFMVKVYRRETVISEAEIDAPTPEQAIRFVRAAVGMSHMPEFKEVERRDNGFSLSSDIGKRKEKDVTPQE